MMRGEHGASRRVASTARRVAWRARRGASRGEHGAARRVASTARRVAWRARRGASSGAANHDYGKNLACDESTYCNV